MLNCRQCGMRKEREFWSPRSLFYAARVSLVGLLEAEWLCRFSQQRQARRRNLCLQARNWMSLFWTLTGISQAWMGSTILHRALARVAWKPH